MTEMRDVNNYLRTKLQAGYVIAIRTNSIAPRSHDIIKRAATHKATNPEVRDCLSRMVEAWKDAGGHDLYLVWVKHDTSGEAPMNAELRKALGF